MRVTDELPDVETVPAVTPLARPADHALRFLTRSADHGRLWIAIAAVGALTGKRTRRASLRGLASLGAASFVSNVVVKPLIGRRRPDLERTPLARRIGEVPWTSSFPSGHAASAAAFAAGATMELPVAGVVLAPLAAAVAYSRVHVGVHYRSDVWAGAAVGLTLAVLGRKLWPVKPWGPALMAAGDAPSLPGGEGLTVIVNQASGSSDGAADAITQALPKATVLEWDPTTDLGALIDGDPRALGVAGGDGTVASVAQIAHDRGLPLAVFPAGTLNHFAKALGPGHRRAHGRGRGGRRGRQGRHGLHRRRRVPEHREHRRLPGDGEPPGPVLAPVRQVAGDGLRDAADAAARASRSTW